jgi:hypothetical protein
MIPSVFPLSLLGGATAVGLIGPGALSIDGLAGFALPGEARLGLVIVGIVGGGVSLAIASAVARSTQGSTASSS